MTKSTPDQEDSYEKYKKLIEGQEPGECQACGGVLELEKVNLEDYQNGKLYMMEGVPAYVCQDCSEVWVPEPIMAEFEKMIDTAKHKISPKLKRQKK
ncbi:MAG: YgiT-type zinc finger protein [Candidatus Margulisbacteria bacterium]|nr:YgiT-type zinc finger protein [Candidatus Margulisiibacteriota bacterium]